MVRSYLFSDTGSYQDPFKKIQEELLSTVIWEGEQEISHRLNFCPESSTLRIDSHSSLFKQDKIGKEKLATVI